MHRLAVAGLTLLLSTVASASPTRAEEFPARPLRVMVGFAPGSAADITARVVGEQMSKTLGQQVVVEARPGAGSSLAAEFVVRAPADGYTLFIGSVSNLTNAAINPNLRFDFLKDLVPVAPLTTLPAILAVHPSLGVSTLQELVALARSKPGELTYASIGLGTVPHLATELMAARAGIRLVHVPYQGSPQAMTDLLAGRVSIMLSVASTVMPHVQDGRLKALATAAIKRPHIAPDLPTIAETGLLPDFDASAWFGLMAPAGTPQAVTEKVAAAANAALNSDAVVAKLRAQGFEPLGGSPEAFARFIARETGIWSDAAAAAGLKK